MDKIGSKIKALRESKGLSQAHIARRLDISPTTYNRYEQDTREPDLLTLVSISKILGVSLDQLVSAEGRPPKTIIPSLDNVENVVDWIRNMHDSHRELQEIISTRLFSIFEKASPIQHKELADLCEAYLQLDEKGRHSVFLAIGLKKLGQQESRPKAQKSHKKTNT